MSIALMPGSRLPAYCTSMGRVMLAALDPSQAQTVLEQTERRARTPHTLTEIAALMAILAQTRKQGFSYIDQEVEIGLRSLAVPLTNAAGQTIAALNVGLAASAEDAAAMIARFLPALERARGEISRLVA
jgi:IclR family transcriptional regulator, pca regulon regulatory protein